jgi:hypothetical protein
MRSISASVLALVALLLVGCSVTLPLSSMINEEYIAKPDNYIVIGDVEGRSSITYFLFFRLTDDAGYLSAFQHALQAAKSDGATNLIEVFSDVETFTFLGLYTSQTTIVHAKAIREVNAKPLGK